MGAERWWGNKCSDSWCLWPEPVKCGGGEFSLTMGMNVAAISSSLGKEISIILTPVGFSNSEDTTNGIFLRSSGLCYVCYCLHHFHYWLLSVDQTRGPSIIHAGWVHGLNETTWPCAVKWANEGCWARKDLGERWGLARVHCEHHSEHLLYLAGSEKLPLFVTEAKRAVFLWVCQTDYSKIWISERKSLTSLS